MPDRAASVRVAAVDERGSHVGGERASTVDERLVDRRVGSPAREDQVDARPVDAGCFRGAAEHRERVGLGVMREPADVEDRHLVIGDADSLDVPRLCGGIGGVEPIDIHAQRDRLQTDTDAAARIHDRLRAESASKVIGVRLP